MSIQDVWKSGDVERFHSIPNVRKQTIAAHSWGVAVIINHIYPEASKDLILEALYHDTAEACTGDIPAPVKRASPQIKLLLDGMEHDWRMTRDIPVAELSEEETVVLKIADALDGMMYCLSRRLSGEHGGVAIAHTWNSYLVEHEWMMLRMPKAKKLVDHIMTVLEGLR